MKKEKLIGIIIFSANTLFLGIAILLSQLSMYIDQLTGSYYNSFYPYIPKIIYVLFLINVSVSIYLYCYKDKKE
ncbi:hypothetical protein SAMN05443428_109108 [Caloramator quimbayensis]|uniref:Solute:sodium symporter small subunit n=1 Tax=Caloramator quimbayensis TaxID=1147123 RepID=A0A1T4XIC7_9CLOT|nr:hypothetical protein [Caloramator quimbayensis]SKA89310.1 hypothetical protein SAMN05443428_109108 [Caloramator quimbayensis]